VHLYNGSTEAVSQMLAALAADLEKTHAVLAKAYEQHNTTVLREELHRVRGSVCYLKLPQLDAALDAFHEAVKAAPQDPDQLERTYAALQKAMAAFQDWWDQNPSKP